MEGTGGREEVGRVAKSEFGELLPTHRQNRAEGGAPGRVERLCSAHTWATAWHMTMAKTESKFVRWLRKWQAELVLCCFKLLMLVGFGGLLLLVRAAARGASKDELQTMYVVLPAMLTFLPSMLLAFLTWQYLRTTWAMLEEMRAQRELTERQLAKTLEDVKRETLV